MIAAFAGCGMDRKEDDSGPLPDDPGLVARGEPARLSRHPLIPLDETTFHFGTVLTSPGRTLTHSYRLANSTGDPITITTVENLKPCCGTIELERSTVLPGAVTAARVRISLGDGTKPDVDHAAVIQTDPAGFGPILLRTQARVLPRIQVLEEPSAFTDHAVPSTAAPRVCTFRVVAHGTAGEPGIDLKTTSVASSLVVGWTGPVREERNSEGIQTRSRIFSITLDPRDRPPGPQVDTITLTSAGQAVLEHGIHWEVVTAITAAPGLIVLGPSRPTCRVLLQARDHQAFRLTGLPEIPGVRFEAEGQTAARRQVLLAIWDGASDLGTGKQQLTIETDHPQQPRVPLALVFLR
jgi:hypothetical protein